MLGSKSECQSLTIGSSSPVVPVDTASEASFCLHKPDGDRYFCRTKCKPNRSRPPTGPHRYPAVGCRDFGRVLLDRVLGPVLARQTLLPRASGGGRCDDPLLDRGGIAVRQVVIDSPRATTVRANQRQRAGAYTADRRSPPAPRCPLDLSVLVGFPNAATCGGTKQSFGAAFGRTAAATGPSRQRSAACRRPAGSGGPRFG